MPEQTPLIMTQEELDNLLADDDTEVDHEALDRALSRFADDDEALARHDGVVAMMQDTLAQGLAHMDSEEKIATIVSEQAGSNYEKFLQDTSALQMCGVSGSDVASLDDFASLMRELLSKYIVLTLGDEDCGISFADRVNFDMTMSIFFHDIIYPN